MDLMALLVCRSFGIGGCLCPSSGPTKTLRVMKLTAVILLSACLTASAHGYSQVTLSEKNAPLQKVLKKIQQQTGYDFLCPQDLLEKAGTVTVMLKDASLEEALTTIFRDKSLQYSIVDRTIVIREETLPRALPPPLPAPPVPIDVAGRITDEEGNPLFGATVSVKGANIATRTDAGGFFTLKGVQENATLEISFIGYEKRTIGVRVILAETTLALKRSETPMDEVVVKPYWRETKRMQVGNSVTVTEKEISGSPVNNPLLALQGRVPGITIQQVNGIPGGGIITRINGRKNIDPFFANSDPLVVVDGIPYPTQNLKTFLGGGDERLLGSSSDDPNSGTNSGSPLAWLNPKDIESITVLKDADAISIYGSRAANGVILIKTKKGKPGPIRTDVNLQHGWSMLQRKLELLNSQQYMEMRWEAKRNDGRAIRPNDYDLRGLWDTTAYHDWQKELIGKTATSMNMQVAMSGGSSALNFSISGTFNKETLVFPGDFDSRTGTVNFNLGATSRNEKIRASIGGFYTYNINRYPGQDYTKYAVQMPPVAPKLYNEDGTLNWAPDPLQVGRSSWFNPLSKNEYLFDTKANNLVSWGNLAFYPLPGLTISSTFGFRSMITDQFTAELDGAEKPENRQNRFRRATLSTGSNYEWNIEPQLNYNRTFGHHAIDFLSGAAFQSRTNNGRLINTYGHGSDLLLRLINGAPYTGYGYDAGIYKYTAGFGRLSYTYRDKIRVNGSIRRDGSSRFGPVHRFNNLWSVSGLWIFSEEKFFRAMNPVISFAKLHGSYGTSGSDQTDDFRYMTLYGSYVPQIAYQGGGVSSSYTLSNPELQWALSKIMQVGLDIGLFNSRVFITANYLRTRTGNGLTNMNIPMVTGFPSIATNTTALIQNISWEFMLSSTNIKGAFEWRTTANLTIPRNKLVAFPDIEKTSMMGQVKIGYPLGSGMAPPYYGINPQTGLPMVMDRFGNPTSNPTIEDNTVLVGAEPTFNGGFTNSFSYKGFHLSFVCTFAKQQGLTWVYRFFPGYLYMGGNTDIYGNAPIEVLDRWQKPGDEARFPRVSTSSVPGPRGTSVWEDVSYVKLKNIVVSYNIPASLIKKIGLQSLAVIGTAQNLGHISRYRGFDPEAPGAVQSLPPLRTITFGINASL